MKTMYNCQCGLCTISVDANVFSIIGGERYLHFSPTNGLLKFWCINCGGEILFINPSPKPTRPTLACLQEENNIV